MTENTTNPTDAPSTGRSMIERSPYILGLVFTTAVFVVSYFYAPPDVPTLSVCLFKNSTGLDCPGCGLTRAFCAIAKGHVSKAITFNLTSPFVFALFGMWWTRSALFLAGFPKPARFIEAPFRKLPVVMALILLFIAAWLVKLVLHFP